MSKCSSFCQFWGGSGASLELNFESFGSLWSQLGALDVSCAGFENTQQGYFEPPYSMTLFLPPGTNAPSFVIEPGIIPIGGGRSCQFRMIAMGEDDLGNSNGATLHSFNLNLTGGFAGVGGVVDNSLKISGSQSICVNAAGMPRHR